MSTKKKLAAAEKLLPEHEIFGNAKAFKKHADEKIRKCIKKYPEGQ